MFRAGIHQWEIIGPFQNKQSVKIDRENYSNFLKRNFEPWTRQKPPKRQMDADVWYICRIMLYHMLHDKFDAMSYLTSIVFFSDPNYWTG